MISTIFLATSVTKKLDHNKAVFQNPAEVQKLLKLSRVLERNPLTQIHGTWIITKRLVERCRVSVRGKPHLAES